MSSGLLRRTLIGFVTGVLVAGLAGTGRSASAIQAPATAATEKQNPSAQPPSAKDPQLQAKSSGETLEKVRKLIDDGRYKEAESAARALLAKTEASNGSESPQTAEALDVLVQALGELWKVRDPEASVLAQRALKIKENTYGTDHPEFAKSLRNLGVLLEEAGDYAGARADFERALRVREKALGPEHPDVAESLSDLARVMQDLKVCRQYEERALAIREKAFGTDHPLVAASLNSLASVLSQMGDNKGARALLERALAIDQKMLGPNHPSVGKDLWRLGYVMPDFAAARPILERAVAIWEETLGPEHPELGRALRSLGNNFRDRGDPAGARKCYERSLAIAEKSFGPEHVDVALALNLLGLVTDDFATARRYFERSLTVLEKTVGPDDTRVPWPLNNLANRFVGIGDYSAALKAYERVLAIREKTLGPEHGYVAGVLNNMGIVYTLLGDRPRALACYERSLAIFEKTPGPETVPVAQALQNIGLLLIDSGDYAGARPILERSLAVMHKAWPDNHVELAGVQSDLAIALTGLGDYPRAAQLVEGSIADIEKESGPDSEMLTELLVTRAELLNRQGNMRSALRSALRAENISRDNLVLTARELPERQALTYAATRVSGMNLALTLAVDDPGRDSPALFEIWDTLSRSREVVLDEMGTRNRTIGAQDSDVTVLAKELASARQQLARLVLNGPGDEAPGRYPAAVEEAREKKEKAEQALAEKNVAFRVELARSRSGLKDAVAVLPARSALVGFARYHRSKSAPTPSGKIPQATPSYLAFVLSSGETAPHIVSLGTAREVEGLVAQWRAQIEQETLAQGHAARRSEAKYRVSAVELRRKVWDPVAPYLRGANRVFIVPDGALNLVNFAALPIGRTNYLVETGPLIHYLSAERDLVPTAPEPKNQGLFALGGPAFDETKLFASLEGTGAQPAGTQTAQLAGLQVFRGNRSACGRFQSMRFEDLPGSLRETDQIVGLWEKSGSPGQTLARLRNAAPAQMSGVLYLKGAEASETAFKRYASGHRVLHLATHGFFLGGRCASALDAPGKPQEPSQSLAGENPLLLSGLVLAGANHRQAAGPNEDDGILTAEEIAAMDLEGVEWAVLSGCDTGVGEIKAGEGVFGLRRAFQIAGAHTVIMSLWPVEDNTARQWMTTLYRQRFVRGSSTAESVRDASLTVLRRRRAKQQSTHPFYWAGFVAAGDWR